MSNISIGDTVSFEYTGNIVSYTVLMSGIYDIYCYGAQGGKGAYSSNGENDSYANSGISGNVRASRVKLLAGMELTVCVGGAGGNGSAGKSSGNATGGSGGYSDGSTGGKNSGSSSSGYYNSAGGGGGGSSYLSYNGTKIISASGGAGGSANVEYASGNQNKPSSGGSGGGTTALTSVDGVEWITEELDTTQTGTRSGNGLITLTLLKPAFNLYHDNTMVSKVNYNGENVNSIYLDNVQI